MIFTISKQKSTIYEKNIEIENQIEKEEAQRLINAIFFPSIGFLFIIINSKKIIKEEVVPGEAEPVEEVTEVVPEAVVETVEETTAE